MCQYVVFQQNVVFQGDAMYMSCVYRSYTPKKKNFENKKGNKQSYSNATCNAMYE